MTKQSDLLNSPSMNERSSSTKINPDWGILIAWMGVIFFMSTDSFSFYHTSRYIVPILHGMFPFLPMKAIHGMHLFIRKMGHFSEYAILGWLWYRSLQAGDPGWSGRSAFIALLLSTLYAASDEYHQTFVPSRGPSLIDVGIDSTGAAFSLLCLRLLKHSRRTA